MGNGACGRVVLLAIGAGVALVPACSSSSPGSSSPGSTVVSGSGLATSCSTDDDCVSAYFGDVCGLSACVPNAAIATSAEAAYQNALNAAESRCPPVNYGGSCAMDLTITTCAMGTCTLTTCPEAPATAHACASTNDASVIGNDAGTGDADLAQ